MIRDDFAKALASVRPSNLRSADAYQGRDRCLFNIGALEALDAMRVALGITSEEVQAACTGVVHSGQGGKAN